MTKKSLDFDASDVTITGKSGGIFNVEVETDFPSEVLDCFSTEEIIQNYADLDKLYEALKEHFE